MQVFLTGATGFLGEYLAAELLRRGHSVWALYRRDSRRARTEAFLASVAGAGLERLAWLKGDATKVDALWEGWLRDNPGLAKVDNILHSAASLRFREKDGEPQKTNLGSAQALKRLTDRQPIQVHLVSTAFVCGRVQGERVYERFHPRGDFVNAYEESKWEAERIWENRATILRPGVIVGEYETGRTKSYTGWYIMVKGGYLISKFADLMPGFDRHGLGIQVPIDPLGTVAMVPVDYVAQAMVRIVEDPSWHNRIYHLTHPDPPTHAWSNEVICRRFDISGIELIGPEAPLAEPKTPLQQMAHQQTKIMHRYFSNNPVFDRTNIDRTLPDLIPPAIDEAYVDRLIGYAEADNWGEGS